MHKAKLLTASLQVVTLILLAASCEPSRANILTVDFNGPGTGTFLYSPYYEDGFRIYSLLIQAERMVFTDNGLVSSASYQGHYDRDCGIGTTEPSQCGKTTSFAPYYDGTPWLGSDPGTARYFDADGNFLIAANGFDVPRIRIDRFGELFSALDFISVRGGYALTSSSGGYIAPPLSTASLGQPVFLRANYGRIFLGWNLPPSHE